MIRVLAVLMVLVATSAAAGVAGDIDGDGIVDPVRLTWQRDDTQRRARLRDGGVYEVPDVKVVADLSQIGPQRFRLAVEMQNPRLLGVVDVDRDGRGEVFVEVAHGASTAFYTVLRLVDGRLVQMTLDGEPAKFSLGGSVTHQGTLGCREGMLVSGAWGRSRDDHAGARFSAFRFDGPRLVVERSREFDWTCPESAEMCPTWEQLAATGFDQDCPDLPFN